MAVIVSAIMNRVPLGAARTILSAPAREPWEAGSDPRKGGVPDGY